MKFIGRIEFSNFRQDPSAKDRTTEEMDLRAAGMWLDAAIRHYERQIKFDNPLWSRVKVGVFLVNEEMTEIQTEVIRNK